MNRRDVLMALTAAALCSPGTAAAHPYHTSAAAVHVRGRRVEVSLRVTPEDLQEALRRRAKRRLDIDADPQVDALAKAYVSERFVVRSGSKRIEPTWIGAEIEDDTAHLYFEFVLRAGAKDVTLHDAIFFDIAPAQVNRVHVSRGTTTRTLLFRPMDPPRSLFEP